MLTHPYRTVLSPKLTVLGGGKKQKSLLPPLLAVAVMRLLGSQPSRNEQGEEGVMPEPQAPSPHTAGQGHPIVPHPTYLCEAPFEVPWMQGTLWWNLLTAHCCPSMFSCMNPPMHVHSPGWALVHTHPLPLHTYFAHLLTHVRMGITSCVALCRALATSPAPTTGDGKS